MYIPSLNAESRPDVLFDFIEANPLGALVTATSDGLFATHIPFVCERPVDPQAGPRAGMGTLRAHIARANRHHREPPTGEALVIFTGPDAYITPSWYATKRDSGKAVPTWNYIAVHVYGTLRWTEDRDHLRQHLEALTRAHEGSRPHPWSISDAPADYIEQQIRAIVGLELMITRLEGKWKMSQNRPAADIDGVVRGLSASPSPEDQAVAAIVAARRPPDPR